MSSVKNCISCGVPEGSILNSSSSFSYPYSTTISLSGGWVPETSRSFHYWQPAPRLRPLPWPANPGNQAMSPHALRKTCTHHIDKKKKKTVERGREGGGIDFYEVQTRSTNAHSSHCKTPFNPGAHGIS